MTDIETCELTGVTKTVTSSQAAIESNPDYGKIRDYLINEHPKLKDGYVVESAIEIPYMRSTEETYTFRKGDELIQATVLVDKRNKKMISLDYV